MSHFTSTAAAVIALGALIPFGVSGQGSLTITNYQLVSETKISRTVSDFAYRADVVNTTGIVRPSLTATLTSNAASAQVVQGSLHFTNVPGNGQKTSTDTFTIRVDRTVIFNFSSITSTFASIQNPTGQRQPRPIR
jgi:hypothetical protein